MYIKRNNNILEENFEPIDVGTGYIVVTKDKRTIVLNEMAAFILKVCDGRKMNEIIEIIKASLKENIPDDNVIREDVGSFINLLEKENLIALINENL